MWKFARTVLALTLMSPVLSMAADNPPAAGAKPSSFAPHPHANHHVYGSPIQPAIVGHKASHHQHASKKRSSPPVH
jgi:hypothetical protein